MARRAASRSTSPTSAACCRSTSPTATRASRSKTFPELSDAELEHYLDANVDRRPRAGAAARRLRRRARQPPRHGPGDPRPGGAALRGQDPRQRARPTPCAPTRASCPTPARGWRPRPASSSAPATPPRASGRRSPTRAARQDAARPAGRRHRALRAAAARRGTRPPARARRATSSRAGDAGLGREGAASAEAVEWFAAAPRRAGRLRRQADRLQGRRPAARRLAAGRASRTRARGCCSSASASTGTRLERLLRALDARRPRRGARDRRPRARARGRPAGAAADARRLPRPRPPGYAAAARAAAGSVAFGGRLEHDEVGRARARDRRARLPEHLPGGLRHGRRRGRRLRRARRSAPTTRACARSRAQLAEALPAASTRDLLSFRLGDGAVPGDRRPAQRLARARRAERERDRAGALGARRRAVELGGRRARGARRLGGPPRRAAAPSRTADRRSVRCE